MKVAIVGTSHSGLLIAASLADVGHHVTVVDVDRSHIARLREGVIGGCEPPLAASLQRNVQALRLDFSASLSDGIRGAEVLVLALSSPANANGITDMSEWATTAGRLSSLLRPYTVVVVAGTVRPGGTQLLRTILEEDGRRAGRDFDVCAIPTMHRHGSRPHGAATTERIVVGGASEHALHVLRKLYAPYIREGAQVVTVGERSAEAMRYASAAWQVVADAVAREVADFCEEGGADIVEVLGELTVIATGEGHASRARRTLRTSPEASELRDARAMAEMGTAWGCAPWTVASALAQVPRTAEGVVERLRGAMGDELSGKRIAIWGIPGWGEAGDGEEALGVHVARLLLSAGAHVVIHEPVVPDGVQDALGNLADLTDSPMAALASADALVVLSDIPAIRATDFSRARRLMSHPVVIDPLWLWSKRAMLDAGMYYNGTAPSPRDAARRAVAS